MYNKPFVINTAVWNNAFCFDKRKNKEIFVPSLIEGNFDDVEIWNKPAFIEFDDKWEEKEFFWLKYFIKTNWQNIPAYIFDNHNHAYFFWHELNKKWIKLVHIDQHSDTRIPESYPKNNLNIEETFEYTNYCLNVWNYIIPAVKSSLISEIYNITWEEDLFKYKDFRIDWDYILNLDLDFFAPELDYIDFELKKKVIIDFAKNAKLITIATSPFFIGQKLAIDVLKRIFS